MVATEYRDAGRATSNTQDTHKVEWVEALPEAPTRNSAIIKDIKQHVSKQSGSWFVKKNH